jgi:dTDP-4-amino-4,6-dideoxygalactose transaminase
MLTAPAQQTTIVKYMNLQRQYQSLEDDILNAVSRVLTRGDFILGSAVEEFENRFAAYCGSRFAIGVANGTDALFLALKAIGIGEGDEVITAPNSFLSTAAAIALAGARPVFADVTEELNLDPEKVAQAITPNTRAILPVHLTGRVADMTPLLELADRHGLEIIEDAAQAVGAEYNGRRAGSFGKAGCFSLHPLKNLNACGDAGVITTDDPDLNRTLREWRNHGLQSRNESGFWAHNSRLDTLQAAILNVKFDHLDSWTEQRRENAEYYSEQLGLFVTVPWEHTNESPVYHTYVIQCDRRDELQAFLADREIQTKIHYPIPIHLQEAAAHLGYCVGDFPQAEEQADRVLSLPIYPELTMEEKEWVVQSIQEFYTI